MAFKMKKPSIIQGTQAHRTALANIQTQGYTNRPDGRGNSSAFQKHEPGHTTGYTDWDIDKEKKEGYKYGEWVVDEEDPNLMRQEGLLTEEIPGKKEKRKRTGGGGDSLKEYYENVYSKQYPDRDYAEYLRDHRNEGEYKEETKPTTKTSEHVRTKRRRIDLPLKQPLLEGKPGELMRPEFQNVDEKPAGEEIKFKASGEGKEKVKKFIKKLNPKNIKYTPPKRKTKSDNKLDFRNLIKDCTADASGNIVCPSDDPAFAKRGKLAEKIVGTKEKYVAGKDETLYGEEVKEGATVKIKTKKRRGRPDKVKVKIKKKGKDIHKSRKGEPVVRVGTKEGKAQYEKRGDDTQTGVKTKYKKVIKIDPTRKKESKLADTEKTKKRKEQLIKEFRAERDKHKGISRYEPTKKYKKIRSQLDKLQDIKTKKRVKEKIKKDYTKTEKGVSTHEHSKKSKIVRKYEA